jgi:hypothetical protein
VGYLTFEDGKDRFSQHVGTELQTYAAQGPKRAQILFALHQEPQITQREWRLFELSSFQWRCDVIFFDTVTDIWSTV